MKLLIIAGAIVLLGLFIIGPILLERWLNLTLFGITSSLGRWIVHFIVMCGMLEVLVVILFYTVMLFRIAFKLD